jgi:hypothetical protein
VHGRIERTEALLPRLQQTSGMSFHLTVVCDGDNDAYDTLHTFVRRNMLRDVLVVRTPRRVGYWFALQVGAQLVPDATHIVNLASDLLPGTNWLRNAHSSSELLKVVRTADHALIAFNDGINTDGGAPHFLVDMALLRAWYGSNIFPTCYKHEYGDTEIATRAIERNVYYREPWAVLYHDHPYTGGNVDETYTLGWSSRNNDAQLFAQRKQQQWPLF